MLQKLKYEAPKAIFVIIMGMIISCVPVKKMEYFNNIDKLQEPIVNPMGQKLIMPLDRINISVLSIDEKTNELFNSRTNTAEGYLVDKEGYINYPFIGKINLKELTVEEAGKKLGSALSEYVFDASVNVQFMDHNVTIMGEVNSQGIFTFSKDKLTIYEAIALGGGISRFGDRKNVILIRQDGDKIMHQKLDISDYEIAGKEYYYILANDVIVVEPMKASSWYNFHSGNFSFVVSTMTTLLVIYTIFFPIAR